RPDDQGPLGDGHLHPVHGQRDELLLGLRRAHVSTSLRPASSTPPVAASPERVSVSPPGPTPGNGHRPSPRCASYSSRKYFRLDWIGLTAPSASAQKALNRMFSPSSSRRGRSSDRPYPCSMRPSTPLTPPPPLGAPAPPPPPPRPPGPGRPFPPGCGRENPPERASRLDDAVGL